MTATVTTTRPIHLAQLGSELGTIEEPAGLSMADDGTERIVTAIDETVTQAQLEAAVEAHEPKPPAPSSATLLQAQVDELTDLTFELLTLLEGP